MLTHSKISPSIAKGTKADPEGKALREVFPANRLKYLSGFRYMDIPVFRQIVWLDIFFTSSHGMAGVAMFPALPEFRLESSRYGEFESSRQPHLFIRRKKRRI
jgi:hypothetical protein